MKNKPQQTWISGRALILYLAAVIVIATVAVSYLRLPQGLSLDGEGLEQVSSQILEIRVVPYSIRDTGRARIYYRAEARAIFERNGNRYDEWLPASQVTSNRLELQWWLSKGKNNPPIVYVSPQDSRVGVVHLTPKF